MALDHRTFIEQYRAPVADPDAARPQIAFCARGEGAARRLAARVRHRGRRRLAYVDTHFPWRRSGFRYDEALALLDLRPDTLFFSMWEMTDDFPAPVLPLAEFPRLATAAGVTDVYAVFLDCAAGLLGEPLDGDDGGEPPPWVPPSIASVLAQNGMRLHVCLYPGGGLARSAPRLRQASRVASRSASVFTWVAECRDLEHVIEVPPALANPRFYAPVKRDWSAEPLQVGFAGDGSPRKGADTAIAAFELLGDGFELHMVGPHAHRAAALSRPERTTFHGWLDPEELRAVYGRCHVFVNPGRAQPDGLGGEMLDGFPTLTSVSAMATGCLLVTTNPRSEPSFFQAGRTHLELDDASPEALAAALERIRADRRGAALMAAAGQLVVRAKLDVFQWTRPRLERIGLLDPVPRERWIDESVPGWMTRAELDVIAEAACRVPEAGVVVEIGSFAGRSSVHWAANSHPSVRVFCIDPFDAVCDEYSLGHLQGDASGVPGQPAGALFARYTRQWADRVVALAQPSPPAHWDTPADVIFVDGDHTTGGVRRDLEFWIDWLKPAGRMLGHDWDDPRVRRAVEDFAARRGLTASCHEDTYIWELGAAGGLTSARAESTTRTGSSR